MKKKENFWELLKRLDEEAGQYNFHLSEANRYFDASAGKTKGLLEKHEKDIGKMIRQLRKALKVLVKQKDKKEDKHKR